MRSRLRLRGVVAHRRSVLVAWAIAFNAVMIFGFAHAAWFYLARALPPVASTLSVMFIPVVGVFAGALWLDEVLHWQDYAAVLLMVAAIASVLWPQWHSTLPARLTQFRQSDHPRDVA